MAIAYLGLGSNLGNRQAFLHKAIASLKKNSVEILKVSSFIETSPVGGPPGQNDYLNGVIKVRTKLTPQELLALINSIEENLGRVRNQRNAPRTIDIDILLYDNLTMQTQRLTIPHPRMKERDFVMVPLKEVEPNLSEIIARCFRPGCA